jgi:hypothetical protein
MFLYRINKNRYNKKDMVAKGTAVVETEGSHYSDLRVPAVKKYEMNPLFYFSLHIQYHILKTQNTGCG